MFDELGDLEDDPTWSGPDAPGSDDELRHLFTLMRSEGTEEELSAERDTVAAMVRIAPARQPQPDTTERPTRATSRWHPSKVAVRAVVVAAGVLACTSTAAATGRLPEAAQSAVARATSYIGLDLPDPRADRAAPLPVTDVADTAPPAPMSTVPALADPNGGTRPMPTSRAAGADVATASSPQAMPPPVAAATTPEDGVPSPTAAAVSGPEAEGLCRAWSAHQPSGDADDQFAAMRRLESAARATGRTVQQFCAAVLVPRHAAPTATTTAPTTSIAAARSTTSAPDEPTPANSSSEQSPSDTSMPDTSMPDTSKPGTSKPGTSKPGTSKPGTSKSNESKPGTSKTGTSKSNESASDDSQPTDAVATTISTSAASPRGSTVAKKTKPK